MNLQGVKSAVVVGASSGIGRELVLELARLGVSVCAVARRQTNLEELVAAYPKLVTMLVHDVTDYGAVPDAVQQAAFSAGGLDLVIYCSGVMPTVGFHEYNFDKDKQMVDVNVLGLVAWFDAAASRMEQTKHGRLVCVGSRAGARGLGSMPGYAATKAFQHSYMESLRNRLARFGIAVVTVKPGPVDTEMTSHLAIPGKMDAGVAARKILGCSHRTGDHYLKFTDRIAAGVIKVFPGYVLRRMKL
jgi:decaprenylphospho-beta-D-erythro-pentofuranosid-2-ulose 2-reductase